ncbi:Something about silencing protein 10 (Sas10) [Metarhizium rileyi]|uniref:Something about silencing protein 10 (Sas10) n=1 Tax=Metarhizium rileyi (strain RCEF 4871) TaxID=1649241 RepID=A0A167F4A1_METRR|nr:Something about silencing protein 10 (Sas10) [Metarhizium rileyi RCEF 4871]
MAKKRKVGSRNTGQNGPKEVDPTEARLGPITTYQDVADSEDEYFLNKDTITLDDEPSSKRRRQEDEDIEFSDEEILGYEDSDDDDDDDDEDGADERPSIKSKKASRKQSNDQGEPGNGDEEGEEDSGWWGSSKQEYYNADNIETEADALEEESEAKRLQQKKLSKMKEEDFVFDGDEWLTGEPKPEEGEDRVVEVLKDIEVGPEMGTEERSRLLSTRYPEFEHLASELEELHPVYLGLKEDAANQPDTSIEAVKCWVLGCYVATLASYFAILTSPARDVSKVQKPLSATDLRDHEVMETLLNCRKAWDRVKNLTAASNPEGTSTSLTSDLHNQYALDEALTAVGVAKKAKSRGRDKAAAAKEAKRLEKAKAIESSVADLYSLQLPSGKSKRKSKLASALKEDDNSDFGEEDTLDARAAADKAARKKSLKFYTSQITQKANKRSGAGRDAGGDMDIPHRERLRDRQARLIAEAEKRGKRDSKHGADLGDDSDDDDNAAANTLRNDEDEYYNMVAHKSKNKRDEKAARYAAYAAASKADRVVETEEVGEDGKRKITYAIEKNKGLAPKRSKDVRNPRVKRRKQYEAKQKKLKSMKAVWKGGEPKGGYQGEISGINVGVVKSIKL